MNINNAILHVFDFVSCVNVFAQLARLLSALRHADAGAAAKAVEGYATILLALQEAR